MMLSRWFVLLMLVFGGACEGSGPLLAEPDAGEVADAALGDTGFDGGADPCTDGGPTVYVAVVSRPVTVCPPGVFIRRFVIGSSDDFIDIPCPTCLCTIDVPFGVSVSLDCGFPGATAQTGLVLPAPSTCDFHQDFLCETY